MAKPLFVRTPRYVGMAQGGGKLEFLSRCEPTDIYGVGLVRIRYDAPVYFVRPPDGHHGVWLQRSPRIPVITRMSGRRIDHDRGPRSVTIYPGAADTTIEPLGAGEGTGVRVSAECLALAASQLEAHASTLVEQVGSVDETLFRIGESLEAEAAAGHPNGILFWSSAADAFIRHLAAHHLSLPATPPRGAVNLHALKTLDDYIHANLAGPLDLDSLAAVIGCERFHFAHRFRATVGMSPHRYVMRLRLERARERIASGAGALAEIAVGTGFADQSHLCRWVRRVYNLRPSDLLGSRENSSGTPDAANHGATPRAAEQPSLRSRRSMHS